MDGRVFLKVKIKSLAEESKIIRHEERKRKVPQRDRKHGKTDTPVTLFDAAERREGDRVWRKARRDRAWYPQSVAELHQLQLHRVNVVSKEARLSHLAYGYIRGRNLVQVDGCKGLTYEDAARVKVMVKKYGQVGAEDSFYGWLGVPPPDVTVAPTMALVAN